MLKIFFTGARVINICVTKGIEKCPKFLVLINTKNIGFKKYNNKFVSTIFVLKMHRKLS